jgi:beta-lactamase regulating signal transducer with metallopeptidase domain
MILLTTWLWQGLVIAGVVALLMSRSRTLGAATRHAIWWAALVAVALLPFASMLSGLVAPGSAGEAAGLPLADAAVPLPAAPDSALVVLGAAWAAAVLLSLVRIGFSLRAVRRLKVASTRLDPARAARLPMWRALDAGDRPELRVSRAVRAAAALGLGRPVILLSPSVLALDDESLDAVVMHEHAHLARRDDWTQLAQALVSALAALHPAVWFIGRRIRREREAACDDFVLAHGAAARRYARSLVELADPSRFQPWSGVAIPGATRSRSELRERVHRLLDASRPRDARFARPAFTTCALVMAIGVGVSARTPAMVMFVERHVPAPPVAALARVAAMATRILPVSAPALVTSAAPVAAAPTSAPVDAPVGPFAPFAQEPVPAVPPLPQGAGSPAPLAPLTASARAIPASIRPVPGDTPPVAPPGTLSDAPPGLADPWVSVARTVSSAGKSTGSSAKGAGASIGRFFGRASKALAGSF